MKNLIILLLFSIAQLGYAQNTDTLKTTPFTIGESFSFYSEVLEENRTLNIYLPSEYHPDSAKRYSVIYLLDGSAGEDFIHIAGLVNFLTFPWAQSIPDAIVVGVANVDRKRDFTYPTTVKQDKADFPTTGGSESFIQFLEKELKPLIEKRYQTNNTSTLLGQSLGGLLATEVLFKKSDLFTNYIIVSPSLWWDNESLLGYDLKAVNAKSIYVGVGKEGDVMERVAKELTQKLEKVNSAKAAIYFDFLEEEDHTNVLHRAAYNAFRIIHADKMTKNH